MDEEKKHKEIMDTLALQNKVMEGISERQNKHEEQARINSVKTDAFMKSLSWLADISNGAQLLRKPSLWFVAFILGIVALMGGLKALIAGALSAVGFTKI